MKIRSDFVTNSSSVSYIVELNDDFRSSESLAEKYKDDKFVMELLKYSGYLLDEELDAIMESKDDVLEVVLNLWAFRGKRKLELIEKMNDVISNGKRVARFEIDRNNAYDNNPLKFYESIGLLKIIDYGDW